MKKTKKCKKMTKKERNTKKPDSHAKSSTISRVYRCCCNFFRQNRRQFPWCCFGMCLFPEENQQPVFGCQRFSEEKWQFSLDVKQKHTFYRRKWTKKRAGQPISQQLFFRNKTTIQQQQQQHTTTTTIHTTTHNNNTTNNNTTTQQQWHNLVRLHWNRRGASTPLWGVETCSHPSRRPNPIPAIPPFVVRTPHLHGAPTTEETVEVWC